MTDKKCVHCINFRPHPIDDTKFLCDNTDECINQNLFRPSYWFLLDENAELKKALKWAMDYVAGIGSCGNCPLPKNKCTNHGWDCKSLLVSYCAELSTAAQESVWVREDGK